MQICDENVGQSLAELGPVRRVVDRGDGAEHASFAAYKKYVRVVTGGCCCSGIDNNLDRLKIVVTSTRSETRHVSEVAANRGPGIGEVAGIAGIFLTEPNVILDVNDVELPPVVRL